MDNKIILTSIVMAAMLSFGAFVTPAFAATTPLTAENQSVSTQFNTSVNIQLNGTGPTGFAYEIDAMPHNGTVTGVYHNVANLYRTLSGAITYTPNAGFSGIDTISFHAYKYINGIQQSSSDATVTITVTPQPQAHSATYKTFAYVPLNIQLQVKNGAIFQVVSNPAHGSLLNVNSATGEVTYKPADGFVGQDGFSFQTSDGVNTSATATVSITVEGTSSHAYNVALDVLNTHPDLNKNTIPESHSGATKNSVQFGKYGMNLMDVLHFLDVKGLKTSDITDGQFVWLMEHMGELQSNN